MSPRFLLSLSLVAGFGTALAASDARADQVHQDLELSRMYYTFVSVPPYTTRTWETTDLSAGADSVLHLYDYWLSSEADYDDDGGVGLGSQVSYTNNSGYYRGFMLLVRASDGGSQGTARLLQDGATMVASVPLGGLRIPVSNGPGWVHETVLATNGATSPWVVALDGNDHMVAYDFQSGVQQQAAVSHDDAQFIMVGTTTGTGAVHLYSNDTLDEDGDGLGAQLEAELGTCDSTMWVGCEDVLNPADTDRDALSDAAEVFGIDDVSAPQHLPAWGADPLHKDVFVELDWNDAFPGQPFTQADAVAAAAIFDEGLAEDLVNPDDLDGVRLHLDIGANPTDPALATLFGDWGGSNSVPDGTSYKTAPATYRDPVRAGVFRYGLLNQGGGGGQAYGVPGYRFSWGVSMNNRHIRSFCHELGHSLGLNHYGHSEWGKANGKANYLSLMNYAYPGAVFSQGDSDVVLNPVAINEQAGIGADTAHVAGYPFRRELGPNGEIDWDFDGEFSPGSWWSVRAPVTFASSASNSAMAQNLQTLHEEDDLPATTPALIRGPGDRMYVFYVDDDRIFYRQGAMNGSTLYGSCPGGDEIGDDCTTWSDAVEVPTASGARGVTALYDEGLVLLAFRTDTDSLRTISATGVQADGTLWGWTNEKYHYGFTDREPEVQLMRVDPAQFGGDELVVGLFYRNKATGNYRWRTMTSPWAPFSTYRGNLMDETNAAIVGAQSPTFANWPFDPVSSPDGTACGALTDNSNTVGLYCYDRLTNRFENLTDSAFSSAPTSSGKPGLAFHTYRSAFGVPKNGDPLRGAMWMTVVKANDAYDYLDVWISSPISDQPDEDLFDLEFPWTQAGKVGNVWTNTVDGAGMALYDDPELGAMKGVWLGQSGSDLLNPPGAVRVRFFPFADGSFRAELTDGRDFQVMERGICRGLASSAYCGPSSFGLD